MNPILNKRCPKCGYLTLCQCNNNIYCLGNDGCDYTDKKLKIKNNYDTKYVRQGIRGVIIKYVEDTQGE